MTTEEAIKRLKDELEDYAPFIEKFEGAKSDCEALDMAIKSLEKDIPKAPKKGEEPRYGMGYEYYDWYCPTCNKFLAYECDTKRKYIHNCECGQRLDWGI